MPGIGKVGVVVGNHALRQGAGADGSERQVGAGSCVHQLRLAHQSGHIGEVGVEIRLLVTGQAGGIDEVAEIGVGGRHLVHDLVVDALTVIRARVLVVVALIRTADLQEMVALDDREIVLNQVVLAIPITGARVLGVDVIWDQRDRHTA